MPDDVVLLDDRAVEVMSYWGLAPTNWQIVGFITTDVERASRPIVQIANMRYVLRRQPVDLTENDTIFRHAFMRHLSAQGLPVPPLLPRPDGHTYAVVVDGIYELQGWLDGQRFLSDGPASDLRLEQAANALALLHQASASFQWQRHVWPEERSAEAIAQAYIGLIRQRAGLPGLAPAASGMLERIAAQAEERLAVAAEALDELPRPPELHLHGDYQAHNLGFGPSGLVAIYDFDAARWGRRLDELAYSLLYFAGTRWEETSGVTPPLVDDGLDVARASRYLAAYGTDAPPAEGEAALLGDAIAVAFPVVFANGVVEDLMFPEDAAAPPDETDLLARLHWAESFWLWLDRYRDSLAEAWARGASA
jgi:Ser/Thr protein kinase RdoA (MazF antagonist)